MISRREAAEIAAVWARRESVHRGYECTPELVEFDLGYLVWSRQPPQAPMLPGDAPTSVIDRETGEVTVYPALPPALIEQRYREHRARRPVGPRTADPAVALRRDARRLPTPQIAAHLTVGTDRFVARGAKGDQRLRHHPLVADFLAGLPAGHLVRGGDRHAELVVLSDALHELDRRRAAAGRPPLAADEARELLGGAGFELFAVREPGDPAAGPVRRPCESCLTALVYFGVLPWAELAFVAEELPPADGPVPEAGRFPEPVARALADAGWRPGFGDEVLATAAIGNVVAVPGRQHRHVVFPAAQAALTAFPGLASGRRGPGEQVWIRRFVIGPAAAAHTADTLADFAAVLGARLFPLGTEGGEAILAVDERSRVFALDQAGEWFLGADIDAALTGLLLGRPAPRVRDDGTW